MDLSITAYSQEASFTKISPNVLNFKHWLRFNDEFLDLLNFASTSLMQVLVNCKNVFLFVSTF